MQRNALIALQILAILSVLLRIIVAMHQEQYERWLSDFVILYVITGVFSLAIIVLPRLTIFLLFPVTILTSIASTPFADDLSFRIPLLITIALSGALSGNGWALAVAVLIHSAWLLAFRDMPTVFADAVGITSIESQITLISVGVLLYFLLATNMNMNRWLQSSRTKVGSLERSVDALSKANVGYSTFATVARQQASLEERNRITHEIHDDIGYVLTNIRILSESVLSKADSSDPSITKPLEAIRQQARTGLYETRRALRLLRAAEYERPRGIEAIRELLRIYESATGVKTELYVGVNRQRIEESAVFLTIYHFVQESLTNAFRHGRATQANVRMIEDGDSLIVSVQDDGAGTDSVIEGIGLQGMREQLSSKGGSLYYTTGPGFTVTANIPLKENE